MWNGWWGERETDTKKEGVDSKREGDRLKTPHFPSTAPHPTFFPPDTKLHTSHPIFPTLTFPPPLPHALFPPPRHATAHGTTGGGKGNGTVLWMCQQSLRLGSVYEPAKVIFPPAEVLKQCHIRLVMKIRVTFLWQKYLSTPRKALYGALI